jgi:hemoglobin
MIASRALFLCAALSAAAACGKKLPPPQVVEVPVAEAPPAAPPQPPLYERLGGHEGVTGIVDSFTSNIAADKRVAMYFSKTTGPKLDYFKAMLVAQLCDLSGGGCEYTGKSMKEAHERMGIGDKQFDAVVQDLKLALEEKQVPADAQKELLDKIETLYTDIVGQPRKPPK